MRKIRASQVLVFLSLAGIAACLAVATASMVFAVLPYGEFRGVVVMLAGLAFVYLYAIAVYRIFLYFFPLEAGEIAEGSRQEFIYHIHLLFFLLFFYSLTRSGAVPVPLMRLVYLGLGARLGANTYSSGIIFDPLFVTVGDNTIIGQSAMVVPHAIEGRRLSHAPIRIGNDVTIGGNAVVLAGAVIGDGAIVAIGAVVAKGTHIAAGEVWGGVPARRLREARAFEDAGRQ